MSDNHKTILVIEDQAETADMFAEMLKFDGYEVILSSNGSLAVEILKKHVPDAVILDMMMPEMSGLDVLKFIRGEEKLGDIPVIVVSAKGSPSDLNAGFNAGATSYLTKPVSFIELRRAIQKALSQD